MTVAGWENAVQDRNGRQRCGAARAEGSSTKRMGPGVGEGTQRPSFFVRREGREPKKLGLTEPEDTSVFPSTESLKGTGLSMEYCPRYAVQIERVSERLDG